MVLKWNIAPGRAAPVLQRKDTCSKPATSSLVWRIAYLLPVIVAMMMIMATCPAYRFTSGIASAQGVDRPASSVRPPSSAAAPDASIPSAKRNRENLTDMWRAIRENTTFSTTNTGYDRSVLVRSEGLDWQSARLRYIAPYGLIALTTTLVTLALFFLLRGRITIEGGRSGRKLPRFGQAERLIHWFVAAIFLLLAVSGLILLFGRNFILPLIGKPAYGILASAMMQGHNLFGPLFITGILAMTIVFFKDNLPRIADLKWIIRGGLLFIGHPPSWKFNAGEKIWFWVAILAGLSLSISGIILEFTQLASSLDQVLIANIVHGTAALVMIAFALGHIYLATTGVEGTLETMTTGFCDEAWARQHHDLWYALMIGTDKAQETNAGQNVSAVPTPAE